MSTNFGPLRTFFFPIYRHEVRKIVPMFGILFLLCFSYSVLRNVKDTVVVTASGAEVIPFIKVWVMLPMAVLLTFLFSKLSNKYSQEKVFYIIITLFVSYFALYISVLNPYSEELSLDRLATFLEGVLPQGARGFVSMCRYWSFTFFYAISELWSGIVLQVLFWGFANEVTKIGEARRFYGFMAIGSNVAAILAGQVAIYLSYESFLMDLIPFGATVWDKTITLLLGLVIGCGIGAMAIFRWMNARVLTGKEYDALHEKREIKRKKKLPFFESFKFLAQSPYLLYIAVLVVAYNLTINLVEVVWKDQLRELYPVAEDFNRYMNNLTSTIGVISTMTAFFMSWIIGRFGWTKTALITPVIMLFTSLGFFGFILMKGDFHGWVVAATGVTPLAIGVFFGGAQNCFSKAAKYSVFDTTKEMAFIPLDHETKLQGKAAIDGVGSRLGKSGGSLIHQTLLILFASLSASAPYIAAILLAVIGVWTFSVLKLGKQFQQLTGVDVKEKATLKPQVV